MMLVEDTKFNQTIFIFNTFHRVINYFMIQSGDFTVEGVVANFNRRTKFLKLFIQAKKDRLLKLRFPSGKRFIKKQTHARLDTWCNLWHPAFTTPN